MQILEPDDRPIPNILLTVRLKCPTDRRQMATAIRFSAHVFYISPKCCGFPCHSVLGSLQTEKFELSNEIHVSTVP